MTIGQITSPHLLLLKRSMAWYFILQSTTLSIAMKKAIWCLPEILSKYYKTLGLFAAAAAASSHFGLLPPRPPHPFAGPMTACRPPTNSPPGMFGPIIPQHHVAHTGLGPSLGNPRSPVSHDFAGGLVDRQSPPIFFPPTPTQNRECSGDVSSIGLSRANSPSASRASVDVERLSPPTSTKKSHSFLTELQQNSDKNSSRSLFQPYLDVDKK